MTVVKHGNIARGQSGKSFRVVALWSWWNVVDDQPAWLVSLLRGGLPPLISIYKLVTYSLPPWLNIPKTSRNPGGMYWIVLFSARRHCTWNRNFRASCKQSRVFGKSRAACESASTEIRPGRLVVFSPPARWGSLHSIPCPLFLRASDPKSLLPAPDAVHAWTRTHARENSECQTECQNIISARKSRNNDKIDPRQNVRIDAR